MFALAVGFSAIGRVCRRKALPRRGASRTMVVSKAHGVVEHWPSHLNGLRTLCLCEEDIHSAAMGNTMVPCIRKLVKAVLGRHIQKAQVQAMVSQSKTQTREAASGRWGITL